MSTSHPNIYITLSKMLYGYGVGVYHSAKYLCTGGIGESFRSESLDEIIARGPTSFREHPTAIRLGRAIFAPLILISHLYDKK